MDRRDRLLKRFRTVIQNNFSFHLVITAIIMGGLLVSCGDAEEVREGMSQYLEKTYETEFVVGKPYKRDLGLLGYEYQAKAYPKDNLEVEFIIKGDPDNSGVYREYYLPVLWSYQGRLEFEKALKNTYGDGVHVIEFEFSYNNMQFKDSNYSEVIIYCNGNAVVDIIYCVFTDEIFDKRVETEKAYQNLKDFIIDNKIKTYIFTVLFFSKKYQREYQDKGGLGEKNIEQLYQEKKLINQLYLLNLPKTNPIIINNANDMLKYYKF